MSRSELTIKISYDSLTLNMNTECFHTHLKNLTASPHTTRDLVAKEVLTFVDVTRRFIDIEMAGSRVRSDVLAILAGILPNLLLAAATNFLKDEGPTGDPLSVEPDKFLKLLKNTAEALPTEASDRCDVSYRQQVTEKPESRKKNPSPPEDSGFSE